MTDWRIRYNRLISEGRCTKCKELVSVQGSVFCESCKNKRKEWVNDRISNGLCPHHKNTKVVPGKKHCAICLWYHVLESSGYILTDEQATQILEKQNYTCPLSGRKLVKGVNASIDHIKHFGSKSWHDKNRKDKTNPLNDIKNLRIVDNQVNTARADYDDNEFINMCKEVAEYNK